MTQYRETEAGSGLLSPQTTRPRQTRVLTANVLAIKQLPAAMPTRPEVDGCVLWSSRNEGRCKAGALLRWMMVVMPCVTGKHSPNFSTTAVGFVQGCPEKKWNQFGCCRRSPPEVGELTLDH